jgi:hypothetical protein
MATCPAGESVLGTGVNVGGVGSLGFVEAYGSFVGGFVSDQSSVPVTVWLQGICGQVSGGERGANIAGRSSMTRYQSDLRTAAAVR